MSELWRKIPGFAHYEASNLGRIRSLDRMVRCYNGQRMVKGKILSPFKAKKTGYLQVCIRGKKFSAHRLVGLAWVPGFFDGAWIDHINGKRDDNRPQNLNWVTPSENSKRSFANGRKAPSLGRFSAEHPKSKAVISRCLKTGKERIWASAMDAVREGYDSSCISRCCAGISRHHAGHKWRFAEAA